MKWIAMMVSGLIGGLLLLSANNSGVSPVVPKDDVLSVCHAADRATQVRLLRELSTKEFPDDPSKAKWFNDSRIAARIVDWTPYTDKVSEAIDAGKVKELADSLEHSR